MILLKESNVAYKEEASMICKEFHKAKRVILLFSIFSFLSFFIAWPGTGIMTINFSPLDVFLLENYSLCFLLAVAFALGFLCEFLPATLSAPLYFDISLMKIRDEKTIEYWVEYIVFALVLLLPVLAITITQDLMFYGVIKYDIIGYLLMYLAVTKGYSGEYYHGFFPFIGMIFASGSLLCLALVFHIYIKKCKLCVR